MVSICVMMAEGAGTRKKRKSLVRCGNEKKSENFFNPKSSLLSYVERRRDV